MPTPRPRQLRSRHRTCLVVVVATAAAIGGSVGAAAQANGASSTTPEAAGALAAAPLSASRFAVVNPNGVLVRSKNVVSARRSSQGAYELVFDRNITGCAHVGAIGSATGGPVPIGQLSVMSIDTSPRTVLVVTQASSGVISDRPFHVAVIC